MKKKFMSLLLAGTMTAASLIPTTVVYADSQKVVTLGADLTEDQKNAVLKYFGVLGNPNVQTLYITNQDERDHLASYVPIEQIGTRTFSCALVNPTTHGGIQVKTANLSWVTSNMIATTLSTSGVVNCEVLAASPFEVSGTGALTGILMAYEQASGTQLDTSKKDLATQELVTTGQIADTIGQSQATEIVNDIKIQIVEGQVVDPEQVSEIVNQVVDRVEENQAEAAVDSPANVVYQLSDEDRARLDELAQQIANQQYDYDDMRETLERVENNVQDLNNTVSNENNNNVETNIEINIGDTYDGNTQNEDSPEAEPETLAEDSILLNTDDFALGEDVIIDATNQEAAPETEPQEETDAAEADPFDITTTDTVTVDDTGETSEQNDFFQEETDAAEETDVLAETDAQEETTAPDEQQTEAQQGEETAAPAEITDVRLIQDNMDDPTDNITGTSVLRYQIPNADLAVTGGHLTISDAFGTQIADVDLSNNKLVASKPVSDEGLAQRGWTEGTELLINIGDVLSVAGTYTVSLDAQIAQAPEGVDPLTLPTTQVLFDKDVNVGSNGFTVNAADMTALLAGYQVSGTVLYDASIATYASMMIDDESVLTSDTFEFDLVNGQTDFNLYLQNTGKTRVTVTFYDVDGNQIDTCTQSVEVF